MRFLLRCAGFLLAACQLAPLAAQSYPSKPVRLIVPFPAGGPADIFGRGLAQGMAAPLGQPVVVENISGASGVLGVDRAAKSPPDGYTLAVISSTAGSIGPFAFAKMPFDPARDLALITTMVRVPEVIAVHAAVPASTLAELVAYAKANPGRLNYGSAGAGGITHLAGELLKGEAGIDLVHVPYKGAAPAVTDLLGGQVQLGVFDVPVLLPHIRAGKLKALAITSFKRSANLPEVPTTAEAGYPKVLSDNWYGLVGPAGMPAGVRKRIHAAAIAALSSPELVGRYAKVSGVAMPSSPEEFAVFLAQDQAKWGAVVRAIGFKAD
ncbi:MAG: tripartite tricarboxylate transporter substrate binding protein [Burkholderiales bacterium]|nr:tripartite tricarboxylate transporter substrate binding protein [Burkholderiales bacterium]